MQIKDKRIKITMEILNGIRVVKLYAWEAALMKVVSDLRKREVHLIKYSSLLKSCVEIANIMSPLIVSLVTFGVFTLSNSENRLTPEIAFVSITLFSQLRMINMIFAEAIGNTVQVTYTHSSVDWMND